jgi:hypothetical protein
LPFPLCLASAPDCNTIPSSQNAISHESLCHTGRALSVCAVRVYGPPVVTFAPRGKVMCCGRTGGGRNQHIGPMANTLTLGDPKGLSFTHSLSLSLSLYELQSRSDGNRLTLRRTGSLLSYCTSAQIYKDTHLHFVPFRSKSYSEG